MKNPSLRTALAHIALTSSLALGVLATVSAAQPPHVRHNLIADVPFAFSSGSQLLPAGQYQIAEVSSHLLILRSADARYVRYLSFINTQRFQSFDHAKLIFHRYGDQYFLYQIWPGSSEVGLQLPRGHVEAEMLRAQNNPAPSSAEVASAATSAH